MPTLFSITSKAFRATIICSINLVSHLVGPLHFLTVFSDPRSCSTFCLMKALGKSNVYPTMLSSLTLLLNFRATFLKPGLPILSPEFALPIPVSLPS